jgi:uncharacterized protein
VRISVHTGTRFLLPVDAKGVSNVRIFGSVAREADESSDLDLLIDVASGHGYFAIAGSVLDVEQLMGVFTQVATPNGLKKRMQARILAEELSYERRRAADRRHA